MYAIEQDIANDIANKVKLKTNLFQKLFSATEEDADTMEMEIRNSIEQKTGLDMVGRAALIVLPLIIEHEAITDYINKTGKYNLRTILPEIITKEEAAKIAEVELRLEDEEISKLYEVIENFENNLLDNIKIPFKPIDKNKTSLRTVMALINSMNRVKSEAENNKSVAGETPEDKSQNIPFDTELMSAAITMGGYHLERGTTKFVDFSFKLIYDIGIEYAPYFKSIYQFLRYYPEFKEYAKEMDSTEFVDNYDITRLKSLYENDQLNHINKADTPEETKSFDPSIYNHPYVWTRLQWMRDNQPEVLLDLYDSGKLKNRVLTIVEQAIHTKLRIMEEHKLHQLEAEEYALAILAPAEGIGMRDNIPKISQKEFDEIVNSVMRPAK